MRDAVSQCTVGARPKEPADSISAGSSRYLVASVLQKSADLHLHQLDASVVLTALGRIVRPDGLRRAKPFGCDSARVDGVLIDEELADGRGPFLGQCLVPRYGADVVGVALDRKLEIPMIGQHRADLLERRGAL